MLQLGHTSVLHYHTCTAYMYDSVNIDNIWTGLNITGLWAVALLRFA